MFTSRCIAAFAIASFPLLSIGHSIEPLIVPAQGKIGFTHLPPAQTGLSFTNLLSEDRAATNRNLLSGSGVAAGDIDGDGNIDLFFCALDNPNVLFRNLGNWRFVDVTSSSPAIAGPDWDSTGATFADVDGDEDLDLLINALGRGTHLFLNDGKGGFTPHPNSGLQTHTGSTSLALADIDADSDLDLYVANFRPTTIRDNPTSKFSVDRVNGRLAVTRVNGRPATAPDLTNRFTVVGSG
ncbi:MAG: FG-GAP repeat domain-containing protein, partial [Limisphaerales bacterium]